MGKKQHMFSWQCWEVSPLFTGFGGSLRGDPRKTVQNASKKEEFQIRCIQSLFAKHETLIQCFSTFPKHVGILKLSSWAFARFNVTSSHKSVKLHAVFSSQILKICTLVLYAIEKLSMNIYFFLHRVLRVSRGPTSPRSSPETLGPPKTGEKS